MPEKMSEYAFRKKFKAAKERGDRAAMTHLMFERLSPARRAAGYTHVRLRERGSACADCDLGKGAVTIDDYDQHLAAHAECTRSVGAWLQGPDGRGTRRGLLKRLLRLGG